MRESIRIAAVGDIHTKTSSRGALQPLFKAMSEAADVALLCGDLTDYGTPEEAEVLAHEIRSALRIPAIAVLGNHDFEAGEEPSQVVAAGREPDDLRDDGAGGKSRQPERD